MSAVRPGGVLEGFRLSPQQRRLCALGAAAEGSPLLARCRLLLATPLDPARLHRAAEEVTARHEILRTRFERLPGMSLPVQVVGPPPAAGAGELSGGDGSLSPPGSSWRLRLSAAGGRQRLELELSALCADRETLCLLATELFAAYAAAPPPPPGVQYADLAEWQNELLEGEETSRGREFWRRPGALAAGGWRLPSESPAAAGAAARPAVLRLPETAALLAEAATAAGGVESTQEAWVLAAWIVLAGRLAGCDEVSLAVGFDGRRHGDLEAAPGPLARDLPLAARLDAATAFADLVRQVDACCRELALWQEYFDAPEGDGEDGPGWAPPLAFEAAAPWPALVADGAAAVLEECLVWNGPFAARLVCTRGGSATGLELHHDEVRLAPAAARCLGSQLAALLAATVADPRRGLLDLPITGEWERGRRAAWSTGRREALPELGLHELVARQARRHPERIAVCEHGRALSYGALWREVEALAARLRAAGVGAETRVALHLGRSLELVVAVLAVLEAGGAFVPLDPALPPARRAFVLADAGVRAVVGEPPRDLALAPAVAVVAPRPGGAAAAPSGGGAAPPARGERLAYLIYTSGSTGTPKGVMVSHRAIVNRVLWMLGGAALVTADDVVLQKTPLSFDAALWEIFVPLAAGGRLALAPPAGHRDLDVLTAAAADQQVTVLQLVPSLLRLAAAGPELSRCRSLRRLFCGGEALTSDLVRRCAELSPAALHNLYGPTEAAIDVTHWPCAPDGGGEVPIGRPLDNLEVHLLDARLRPVAVGELGEICAGGVGLARGYHGRPALTAASFVPSPAGEAGGRLYRTGDLGRWSPEGWLAFAGRRDGQVKLHGVRVEPGEVEAVLARHPRVAEVAVAVREVAGTRRLVAWVVPRPGAAAGPPAAGPPAVELRAFAARELPDAMLPAAFVTVPHLPRTASGKLDRGALPAPAAAAAGARRSAPVTPAESALAAVWQQLLGVAEVGREDNFFQLGGDSILTLQVVHRARSAGLHLTAQEIFESPTLAAMAAAARRVEAEAEAAPPADPSGEPPPLSFPQQQMWVLQSLDPASAAYNLPVAFLLVGALEGEALAASLEQMILRHDALRTTCHRAGGGWPAARVEPEAALALSRVDLSGLPEERRLDEALAGGAAATLLPFDLARAPLMRACLFRLDRRRHVLHLVFHHIAFDLWSWQVFFREWVERYQALRRGERPPSARPAASYGDFARHQRRHLVSAAADGQLAYWREQLAGSVPVSLAGSGDPGLATAVAGSRAVALGGGTSQRLRRLAAGEECTLFMALLALFDVLLHQRTGSLDVAVGSPVAGRTLPGTEDLVGNFVNTLVLRTRLDGDPTFREVLARVRTVQRQATAAQEVPFERVAASLRAGRSESALFHVWFVLHNVPLPAVELPDLEVRGLGVRLPARHELSLSLWEGPEGVEGSLEFRRELVGAPAASDLAEDLAVLAAAVVADPDRRLADLAGLLEQAARERERRRRGAIRQAGRERLGRVRRREVSAGLEGMP